MTNSSLASPTTDKALSVTRAGVRDWVSAVRPRTLSVSIIPVIVGSAAAATEGLFRFLPAAAVLAAAVLIQIGTNLANDLFDFAKGADGEDRIGPKRVLQEGRVTKNQMRSAIVFTFALASLFGSYLIYLGGWPILLIGILSLFFGITYTGGPFPLGYHGLGDIFVFIFFGLVSVTGTYYIHTLNFSWYALSLSIPIGLLATSVLVVNNIRDIESDRKVGKNTLAVRFGRKITCYYYAALFLFAWLSLLVFCWVDSMNYGLLLPFILIPKGIFLIRLVSTRSDGPSLIKALAETVKLEAGFGVLMSIGILLHKFI